MTWHVQPCGQTVSVAAAACLSLDVMVPVSSGIADWMVLLCTGGLSAGAADMRRVDSSISIASIASAARQDVERASANALDTMRRMWPIQVRLHCLSRPPDQLVVPVSSSRAM